MDVCEKKQNTTETRSLIVRQLEGEGPQARQPVTHKSQDLRRETLRDSETLGAVG